MFPLLESIDAGREHIKLKELNTKKKKHPKFLELQAKNILLGY